MKNLMGAALLATAIAGHQPQQPPQQRGAARGDGQSAPSLLDQMMKYDKNQDGKLTKQELGDSRLVRLFTRADADNNGEVTADELKALESSEGVGEPTQGRGRRGGPPRGGEFGGPDGPPPDDFGGRGGPGGPPPRGGEFGGTRREGALTGELIPPQIRSSLKLTQKQEKDLQALQKDVDTKLDKILTAAQKRQLRLMPRRGPGGPPPGGPGGFGPPPGGPGGFGPPPDGFGPGGGPGGFGPPPGGPGGAPPGDFE